MSNATTPPIHENCVCEIQDGIWTLGSSNSGPCAICEQMAAMWNMGIRSGTEFDILTKISQSMHKFSTDFKGYQRAGFKGTLQQVLEDQRADVSIISTDQLDSYKTIFEPDGMDWSEYLGPIGAPVMNQHSSFKIGRCAWVKPYQAKGVRGFIAKTVYDDSTLGNMAYNAVKSGGINGKSIGFIPLETRKPSEAELKKYPDLEEVISRCVIMEYSTVVEPANPSAKVVAREAAPIVEAKMTDRQLQDLIMSKIDIDGIVRKVIRKAMGRV
jgi:hypothetical protein